MSAERPARVTSPLGKDVLLLQRMVASEELGRLPRYDLDLLSTDARIKLDDLLGKGMTVILDLPDFRVRHFHGLVCRVAQTGRLGRYVRYQVTLRPWLWLLTRTADCHIHFAQTVPDILKDVFRRHGFSDFKDTLRGTYRKREYCVQYRETTFNFVSRLMEEEGIYYFIEHEEGRHHVVLADTPTSHKVTPGCARVPFVPSAESPLSRLDHVFDWQLSREAQTGLYEMNDQDFERPRADLTVKASNVRKHPYGDLEIYDHPGYHVTAFDASGQGDAEALDRGQGFVQARIEELQAEYERVSGTGNVRALAVGGQFNLTDFHREDQNRGWLVIATTHDLQISGYEGAGEETPQTTHRCSFTAQAGDVPFRTRRLTPKPHVSGPQTATVVGKSGEEIWTDTYGRVKVQFHWDREGKSDESSSCWVRVAQPWAGRNWGAIHVPRMGHEVVIEFLEGDPDRPIITGSVYNGDNKPPYDLPANQTQTGIKTRSSKNGSGDNFNEIRFEDLKGSEQLYIHAERNQDIVVEADETHSVGHDRAKTIGHDETTRVKNNRTETVDKDETITIHGNRVETVDLEENITISGNRTESVAKNETITVGGGRTENVAKDESITIGGGRTEKVAKDDDVTIGSGRMVSVGKDDSLQIGKTMQAEAGDQIVLRSGAASITLKKDGTISIQGKDVTINGSGAISIKAAKDVVIKGAKVLEN